MKIGTTEIVWKMVQIRYLVSALSDVLLNVCTHVFTSLSSWPGSFLWAFSSVAILAQVSI